MPANFSIQVIDKKQLSKLLEKKSDDAVKAVENEINTAVLALEGEIKESIAGHRDEPRSVDTGAYLNSVQGRSKGLQGTVASRGLPYPIYLEEGTTKIRARRHFGNSVARKREEIKQNVGNAVKEALKG